MALCGLTKLDFSSTIIQYALENAEAIDVLINVLEADDYKCKVRPLAMERYTADSSIFLNGHVTTPQSDV